MSKHDWIESFLRERLKPTSVSAGPFAGLQYPAVQATCSTIAPKLLGTYEAELIEFFADSFASDSMSDYRTVVDIGCAEGFYAVGCARRFPHARVDAYDIDHAARQMCEQLAECNGVQDRVTVLSECTEESLCEYGEMQALVISDCEGAEMSLFTSTVIRTLAASDFVIEVHEHLGADGDELRRRFEPTHDAEKIACLMDIERLQRYRHPLIDKLSDWQKIMLVAECRSNGNGWLIARSRMR